MSDERLTPEKLVEAVDAEIRLHCLAIKGHQDDIKASRSAIAHNRARIAELRRMLPRKPRAKKVTT